MHTIRKEQLIRHIGWDIVPLDCKDKDTIVAYIWGIVPIRIKGSNLTQEQFDKLYPTIK
ncbi:MAG: hypothetical protein VB130_00745 [Clostridium sp.]|nr:hypothetical protein [Clostridium sp.]